MRDIGWPYPDGRFPEALGVVAQRTVLEGREPARAVVHDADGYWLAGDQVNDPNEPGASVLVCMLHLVDSDPSLAGLATMPPGTVAWRSDRGDAWKFEEHRYPDE
jgi:hypothetical protein